MAKHEERSPERECYSCKHRREIPGDCHIQCVSPDPEMTGHKIGIRNGWFFYPFNFHSVWKAKLCRNYEAIK